MKEFVQHNEHDFLIDGRNKFLKEGKNTLPVLNTEFLYAVLKDHHNHV